MSDKGQSSATGSNTSPTRSVLEIIQSLRRGIQKEEHFRQLFELYLHRLVRFFIKRGWSPEESRDLTQETLVHVWTGIGQLRRESGFDKWLFQIAVNVHRKRLRRRLTLKRRHQNLSPGPGEEATPELADLPQSSSSANPLETVLQGEQVALLREALKELPEQMRKCVIMRFYQELRYREIARLLHLSEGAVKAHVFQGIRKLKVKLAQHGDKLTVSHPPPFTLRRDPS